uniref:Uncharacterized protein n=1 Tax=Arundo donax TaxID=35708 RepID=A0A0A9BTR8_ARUDO
MALARCYNTLILHGLFGFLNSQRINLIKRFG